MQNVRGSTRTRLDSIPEDHELRVQEPRSSWAVVGHLALGTLVGAALCFAALTCSPSAGIRPATGVLRGTAARSIATSAPLERVTAHCQPRESVLADFGSGDWILDHTEVETWAWYMDLLRVPESARNNEYNCSDIHQYVFTENAFSMNHTIPLTNFSLTFQAGIDGTWEKNPYPAVTPAGFDTHDSHVEWWRNSIDSGPAGTSCSALRTQMAAVVPTEEDHEKFDSYWVVFWRELVSPTYMKVSLHVTDLDGKVLEPWASKGMSHRYFKKTV